MRGASRWVCPWDRGLDKLPSNGGGRQSGGLPFPREKVFRGSGRELSERALETEQQGGAHLFNLGEEDTAGKQKVAPLSKGKGLTKSEGKRKGGEFPGRQGGLDRTQDPHMGRVSLGGAGRWAVMRREKGQRVSHKGEPTAVFKVEPV